MFDVQNEHKSRMKLKSAPDDQEENPEGNPNDSKRPPAQPPANNNSISSGLSDLTDFNSRAHSLLNYATSSQMNGSSKMMIASRAMQRAQDYRAKVVTFFMNGDPFKAQFRVTMMRNRDFPTFNKLLDHLTDRTKLPIKYVFDAEGKRLTSVDEFEHLQVYIYSTTNKFYQAQYGSKALQQKSNFRTSNFADIRPFLRPISSKNKYNNRSTNSYNSSESSLETKSLNGVVRKSLINREQEEGSLSDSSRKSENRGAKFMKGKVVTIINRKLPAKSSRVLLNLRSARTFEHVVKDLGESVSLPMARILLTPFGNEVRSISQLRRSLNEIDTFFVDDLQLETIEDWNKLNSNKSTNLNSSMKPTGSRLDDKSLSEKDELIERLSLAASSSEELNKGKNVSPLDKGNEAAKGPEKKTGIVTPIFNQSLTRTANELDTISIDSFDTLPDTMPISSTDHQLHQIQQAPNFLTSNPQSDPSLRSQLHPSFVLLNGFTAEFKINKGGQKEYSDKQIQVDIRYLPMTGENFGEELGGNEPLNVPLNASLNSSLNALTYSSGAADFGRARQLPSEKEGSGSDSVKRRSNRFQRNDSQAPTFYVLDDLFGETSFKRKRSLLKGKPGPRDELLRPDRNPTRGVKAEKMTLANNLSSPDGLGTNLAGRMSNSLANQNSANNLNSDNLGNNMTPANHMNSSRTNPSNKTQSNPPSGEPDGLDLNNNLADRKSMNEMGSAMNDLANKANQINSHLNSSRMNNSHLNNHQSGNLNGDNGPSPSFNNQYTNGPTNAPSTEPNSISNSRNSYLDETNSFSNSATPDQQNLRPDRMIKESRGTPFASPIASPNQPDQLNQLANKRPSNELARQPHPNNSENNGLTSPTAADVDKVLKPYESQLISGIKVPSKRLRLKKIFGYNGNAVGNNLEILGTDELAYFVGVFVVLWDPVLNVQRHYAEHTEDIVCMSVDHRNQLIVTAQRGNDQENKNQMPVLKIWNYRTLETLFTMQDFDSANASVLSAVFSKSGFLLVLVLLDNDLQFYCYDWRSNRLMTKVQKVLKNEEEVYGVLFHPDSDDHLLSYGKRHLNLWTLGIETNELIPKKTFKNALKNGGSSITCLKFLEDGYLLATDSDGRIFLWTPVANEICDFESSVNEIKAHDSSISSILIFPHRYIVTGDTTGVLKTWTFDKSQFNLLNVATLPSLSGAIRSLSFANEQLCTDPEYFMNNMDNEKIFKIYIGTSTNMVFSGSALQATQYIILYEGHSYGIRAIAVDSVEKNWFYTAGVDHKICKWSKNLLLWCVRCKYQCTSMAVYPGGETLAVGCTNGIICILSTTSSEFITQISLANSAIGCLAYSPDSLLLAAGTESGQINILPVFDHGSSYDRISALKCNYPILSLQWSLDCRFILTSINDNDFQEILLWDLNSSNFIKGISIMAEQIKFYDATCLSGDDVRGIWENDQLDNVVNLCCHCSSTGDLVVTGDENGNVRLFTYPCLDQNASFQLAKQSSGIVTETRFLKENNCVVTSGMEGSLFIWELI